MFRQDLYDQKGQNARIRLAFVDALSADSVPLRLRAWHQFRPLESNIDLDQWVAWIAGRLGLTGVVSPTVRWPEPLAGFCPGLADREIAEWPAIVDLLAGRSPHRILMLRADSGYGKSKLLTRRLRRSMLLETAASIKDPLSFFIRCRMFCQVIGRLDPGSRDEAKVAFAVQAKCDRWGLLGRRGKDGLDSRTRDKNAEPTSIVAGRLVDGPSALPTCTPEYSGHGRTLSGHLRLRRL